MMLRNAKKCPASAWGHINTCTHLCRLYVLAHTLAFDRLLHFYLFSLACLNIPHVYCGKRAYSFATLSKFWHYIRKTLSVKFSHNRFTFLPIKKCPSKNTGKSYSICLRYVEISCMRDATTLPPSGLENREDVQKYISAWFSIFSL